METHMPRYYGFFRCLAGECPHTCCAAGWEIPVDPASAALYDVMPGVLGEQVRAFLEPDPGGELCFPLRGGVCPFLNGEGLCQLHIKHGEMATPLICRAHPRFSYHYGPLREEGLCASCPEAARLILAENMEIAVAQSDSPGEKAAPPLLSPLLLARETAIELLSAERTTLPQRLQALLLFANEVQVLLDEGQTDAIPRLCDFYGEEFPLLSPELEGLPSRHKAFEKCLIILEGLAILQPQWKVLLAQGRKQLSGITLPPFWGERAAAYFLYRHWLRGMWDGDVLTWAEFSVLGVAVSALLAPLLAGGFPEAFRLFCLELEHSEENMARLQDALWDRLSLAELLAVAGL